MRSKQKVGVAETTQSLMLSCQLSLDIVALVLPPNEFANDVHPFGYRKKEGILLVNP